MKFHFVAALALLVSQGFAQTAPAASTAPAPSQSAAAVAKASPVAQDAAVITVNGVCTTPSSRAAECKTVITRAEFERLMDVLALQRSAGAQQSIPPEAKRQLAMQYSRLLLFADLAEKQGLQNTAEAKELIQFARLEAMTEELARALRQKAMPTPEEITNFYDRNHDRYTRWDLQRVVVPLDPKREMQANKEELKKLAEELRQRASKGGDFDALQKEAYEKAGMKDPPDAKLVVKPGTSLPEPHAAVYQLKPGELSPVLEDPSGFYFYKLDSSRLTPLDQNKAEIQQFLAGQKTQEIFRRLIDAAKVTLNPNYFDLSQQNAAPSTSSIQPLPAAGVRAEMH